MKKQTQFGLCLIVAVALVLGFSYASRARADIEVPGDAKPTFDAKCSSCHGKDGRAKSLHAKHIHARDLTDAVWQNDVTDERIFNSISNGRNKMPAFKKKLSEAQIDELVAYVRRFRR